MKTRKDKWGVGSGNWMLGFRTWGLGNPNAQHLKPNTQFLLYLLLLLPSLLPATHIVGGEMNYTCLGNDEYEITLTIFRDCYNGNPNAWFDDPAAIGVFSAQNDLLETVLIPWDIELNDTLNPILSGACFVAPPDVCVHTTTYTTVVELAPRIGGYQLAYQRCCRNQTIVNIVDPLDTGATYGVTISERALLECNSNPKFREWPPLYICVNEPIQFDQAAVDLDGDSIVYRLCTPLQGADPDIPQPQPPNPPPYDPIQWIDPPYSEDNMLNGSSGDVPLQINSRTGLLTGLPNTIGQFVVGVCVEEYRDGELISETRRDFQYNVGVCGKASAAFAAPETQCNNLEVTFLNQSDGANSFRWLFGDGASSNSINTAHTYADTGSYTVRLIAEPNTICADTSTLEINLQETAIQADFSYALLSCSDSLVVQLEDLSSDSLPINNWYWEVLGTDLNATEQHPQFAFYNSGTYFIQLTVTAANGCQATQTIPVMAQLIEEVIERDTLRLCPQQEVNLNPIFDSNYQYFWSPAESLDNPIIPNPTARPTTSTTYTVRISDVEEFCVIEKQIHVQVAPPIEVTLPNDTTICSPSITLQASATVPVDYAWISGGNVLSTADTVRVTPLGTVTYWLETTDTNACMRRDTVQITGNGINTSLDSLYLLCEGESLTLSVENIDPTDTLTYQWTPTENILAGANSAIPVVRPTEVGRNIYQVAMSNQFACTRIDSTVVAVIDTSDQLDFVFAIQCSGFAVQFNSTSVNAPYYIWDFGDPENPNSRGVGAQPSYVYPDTGTYEVRLSLAADLACKDTLVKTIQVTQPQIRVDFTTELLDCSDEATIQFTDLSTNNQSEITSWFWRFSNGTTSREQHPNFRLTESQLLQATLVITSNDGCVDSLTKNIPITLLENTIADTVYICNGRATALNPNFKENYTYTWSPTTDLDEPNAANPLANPSENTVYTVTITDSRLENCALVATVQTIVPPLLELSTSPDTTICEEEVHLSAFSPQAVTYLWTTNQSPNVVLSTEDTLLAQPTGIQEYYVKITDEVGCQLTDTITIENAQIQLALSGSQTICVGDTARIRATNLVVGSTENLTYQWTPTERMIGDGTQPSPFVFPDVSTTYRLRASNAAGCTFEGLTRVEVFDFVPPLDITAEPDTLVLGGQEAQLTATYDENYTYQWQYDPSLSNPLIYNPLARPDTSTTYILTIRNEDGCINQREIRLVVLDLLCEDPYIFVPNTFTPNGDGKNDVLRVRGVQIESLYFAIYNRWGQLVFETRDPLKAWDGQFNGEALSPGVFGYYLEAECFNGASFFKKGNLTLLR